jgi:glycosyltransferase involved in cell wall biosynthesis
MRIAYFADPLDRQCGGIHVYVRELLTALSRVDRENEYIVIRAEQTDEFEGFEEVVLPYSRTPGARFRRIFFQLPQIAVNKRADIVVEPAHFGPFNLPRKIKRVTVIHDMTMFLFPEHHVFLSQFLQRQLLPRILKKANHILTDSASTSRDLNRLFPLTKDKTTTVLLGKDALFRPCEDANVLRRYGIRRPYLLYLGTLEPRKNVATLIRAFDDFKTRTGMPHQLVLAGAMGWKVRSILEAIEHSAFQSEIVVPGFVGRTEKPVLYSMAELFVYPSEYEGFGLPVLEAMACGTPVITSNTSSLPEVGGSAVHYVSPESADQLSKQISVLCSDPGLRETCRRKGLDQARQFSWEKTALETMKVFEQLR